MKKKIRQYLSEIEQSQDIEILLACETGSRAWGFPSTDSDFDVRIIYKHKKDWYLLLNGQKDSIDLMFENNEIDITGWDLRKSLKLLQKSNASLLERIQSPIIYRKNEDFLKEILIIAQHQYSRIASIHHYLSMAKRFRNEMQENKEYKLKKFFYTLRSATACKWILEKEEIPPIEFMKMIRNLEIDSSLTIRIKELITLKATKTEGYYHKGENKLFSFIESCIQEAEEKRLNLPKAKGSIEELNNFFIKTIS